MDLIRGDHQETSLSTEITASTLGLQIQQLAPLIDMDLVQEEVNQISDAGKIRPLIS